VTCNPLRFSTLIAVISGVSTAATRELLNDTLAAATSQSSHVSSILGSPRRRKWNGAIKHLRMYALDQFGALPGLAHSRALILVSRLRVSADSKKAEMSPLGW
jgi:hypothetical protein